MILISTLHRQKLALVIEREWSQKRFAQNTLTEHFFGGMFSSEHKKYVLYVRGGGEDSLLVGNAQKTSLNVPESRLMGVAQMEFYP